MCCQRMAEKTVLVLFGERKRPVTFLSGGGNETQSLIESVGEVFKDVLGTDSGHRGKLLLQQKSEEWEGEFVDIPECGTVSDRAVLKLSMIDSAGTSTEVKFSKAV